MNPIYTLVSGMTIFMPFMPGWLVVCPLDFMVIWLRNQLRNPDSTGIRIRPMTPHSQRKFWMASLGMADRSMCRKLKFRGISPSNLPWKESQWLLTNSARLICS